MYTKEELELLPIIKLKAIGKELQLPNTSKWRRATKEVHIDSILQIQSSEVHETMKDNQFTRSFLNRQTMNELRKIGKQLKIPNTHLWRRSSVQDHIRDILKAQEEQIQLEEENIDVELIIKNKVSELGNLLQAYDMSSRYIFLQPLLSMIELPQQKSTVRSQHREMDTLPPINTLISVEQIPTPIIPFDAVQTIDEKDILKILQQYTMENRPHPIEEDIKKCFLLE